MGWPIREMVARAHDLALNSWLSRLYVALFVSPRKLKRVQFNGTSCRFVIHDGWENSYLSRFPHVSPNETATFQILKECVQPGDVVFDVGANIGAYVVWLANDGRAKQVVALEPDGENYATLKANVAANDCERVVSLPFAAADSSGLRKFMRNGDAWGCLEGSAPNGASASAFDYVSCVTLDSLVRDNIALPPDVLLIDVDGGEMPVLHGATEVLKSSRLVIVEVDDETEQAVDSLLTAAGFKLLHERKQRRGNRVYSKAH